MSSKRENLLPLEYQFETTLKELNPLVVEELEAAIEAGDIIMPEHEVDLPFEKLWEMAETFALASRVSAEEVGEVARVMYRSILLGVHLTNQLSAGAKNVLSFSYLRELGDDVDIMEVIREDVQNYLGEREMLDRLIFTYADNVDPSGDYGHHVETMAGFVLMVAEQDQADHYINARFEALDSSEFFEGNE